MNIVPKDIDRLKLYGRFYWEDPNKGRGFAGWDDLVMAESKEDATDKFGGYDMGRGVRKTSFSERLEIVREQTIVLKQAERILSKLERIINNQTPPNEH